MATLATYQDVLDEIPSEIDEDQSGIAASQAHVERLIQVVEGDIVSKTRIKWVDDFSDVNDANKELLKATTVAGVILKITNAEKRNFSSMRSAETTLDVLDDIYQRNIRALSELDTKDDLRSVA